MPGSMMRNFSQWILGYPWRPVLDASDTQAKADPFYSILSEQPDAHFLTKKVKISQTDTPWMTSKILLQAKKTHQSQTNRGGVQLVFLVCDGQTDQWCAPQEKYS